jgi:spore coat polysaccharide biosynthesis protein SpsF (cytidylyltransferase family)
MTVAAFVQARMGSSRLPGKVMMPLEGAPLIGRVLERVRAARTPSLVALVTGSRGANLALAEHAEATGVPVFCGSDDDVLERYLAAARHFGADVLVRITGDCPLIDPDVLDLVVQDFQKGGADYVSNVHPPTYPDGLDVEVMSLSALERASREATLASEREHVTPYLWKDPGRFKQRNVVGATDLSPLRWIVDDERDLAFVRAVYRELLPKGADFRWKDVLALVQAKPELARLNAGTTRNEGYALSLAKDKPWTS